MNAWIRLIVAAGMVGALAVSSGCKVWYKRGAGAEALARDQAACRDQTGTSEGAGPFTACMESRGWHQSGSGPVFVGAGRASALAPAIPGASSSTERPAYRPDAGTVERPPSAGPSDAPTAQGRTIESAVPPPVESRPAATASHGDERLPRPMPDGGPVSVGSWFKIGGTPEGLKRDQDACLTRSSDQAPDPHRLHWTADRTFAECMRERGWYGMAR